MTPSTLAALFLAAVVTHLPSLANQFAFDDAVILANPAIQSLRTLPAALASPWWYTTSHLYRPLTLASFAVERAIAGSSPLVPHAVNVMLHGVVVVLLARLLARFVPPLSAIVGALLFAVLPVHAEAVASVVGRAELLSAIAMVALLLLVTGDRPPARRERIFALLLGAAALASKEGGVVAPALAFAAAWTHPTQRPHAVRWAASTAIGTVMLLAARLAVLGTLGGDLPNPVFRILTAGERITVALAMVPRAASMLVLPIMPAIEYVPTLEEIRHPQSWMVALGLVIVAAVTVVIVRHLRRRSALGLGACVIAATHAPTANLLFASGVVLTGRTLYAPSLGAAFIVSAFFARHVARRGLSTLIAVVVATTMVVAGALTWRETTVWRSSESVLAQMQRRHPGDYRSFLHLAYLARDGGRDVEALTHFREAAARFPADPEMLTDGATVALRLHDTTTARAWLEHAVAVSPRAARGRTRLVGLHLAQGDSAGAKQLLIEGLRHEPTQRVWREELRAFGVMIAE